MKHILSIADLSKSEMDEIIDVTQKVMVPIAKRRQKEGKVPKINEAKVTLLFLEPSTRTMGSYSEAIRLLGWEKEIFYPEASSLKKKESFGNTIRMLAVQGAHIIVIRTGKEGAPRFAAEILEKEGYPTAVHNAGDGTNQHPTQTLLDRLTIKEVLGRLNNFTFGAVGDLKYGRTIHSLISSFSPEDGIRVKLVSAPETRLPNRFKKDLDIEESDSMEILEDCDIIYVTRIQEERILDPQERESLKGKFRITKEVLDSFKKDVKIMHPLPYVDEISPEVRRDPRVIVDKQAWYGIPTRMYLLQVSNQERFTKINFPEKSVIEEKVIKDVSLSEYLKRKEKKKIERYFRPISYGTVIDHLPVFSSDKIKKILKLKKNIFGGVIHTIEGVSSSKMGIKDVMVLENIFLSPEDIAGVSLIAPQATYNVIKDGRLRKLKFISRFVKGIGKCPNKLCITHYEEESEPKFEVGDTIRCVYCEREFTREEILATI